MTRLKRLKTSDDRSGPVWTDLGSPRRPFSGRVSLPEVSRETHGRPYGGDVRREVDRLPSTAQFWVTSLIWWLLRVSALWLAYRSLTGGVGC